MGDREMSSGEARQRASWGIGIALGLSVGVALGSAMQNIGVGVAIGMGIGIAFAAAFSAAKPRRADPEDAEAPGDEADPDDDRPSSVG